MSSAIDVFREQREAADQVHARLTEISVLLDQLRHQINALAINDELRAVLRHEQSWLERAQVVLSQVRSFREQDALRFWPGVVRRSTPALRDETEGRNRPRAHSGTDDTSKTPPRERSPRRRGRTLRYQRQQPD
jgi:hypothetical protein